MTKNVELLFIAILLILKRNTYPRSSAYVSMDYARKEKPLATSASTAMKVSFAISYLTATTEPEPRIKSKTRKR